MTVSAHTMLILNFHATFSCLNHLLYDYHIRFFVASHEILSAEDSATLNYNWYRFSKGNDQTVFIRLVLCFLDQILTYQIYDLHLILSYCKDNRLRWQRSM